MHLDQPDPSHEPQPFTHRGTIVSRESVLSRVPTAAFEGSSYWLIEKTDESSSGMGQISTTLPLHFHTDGEHRLTMLSGVIRLELGSQEAIIHAGDYARIPTGAPHKLTCMSDEPAWFVTFDSPPMDPSNFHWIEAAPTRIEGCPFCVTHAEAESPSSGVAARHQGTRP